MESKKDKRHKCHNCGRIRFEKYMQPFVHLEHGVPTKELYPLSNKGNRLWECMDCEENFKKSQ